VAVSKEGELFCWGDLAENQDNTTNAVNVELPDGDSEAEDVLACDYGFCACRTTQGKIYVWGDKYRDPQTDCITKCRPIATNLSSMGEAIEAYLSGPFDYQRRMLIEKPGDLLALRAWKEVFEAGVKIMITIFQSFRTNNNDFYVLFIIIVTSKDGDVQFKVQDKILCAHRAFLIPRSEYFRKMLSGAWKESLDT